MATEMARSSLEPQTPKPSTIIEVMGVFIERGLEEKVPFDEVKNIAIEVDKFGNELTKFVQPYAFEMHIKTLREAAINLIANVLAKKE